MMIFHSYVSWVYRGNTDKYPNVQRLTIQLPGMCWVVQRWVVRWILGTMIYPIEQCLVVSFAMEITWTKPFLSGYLVGVLFAWHRDDPQWFSVCFQGSKAPSVHIGPIGQLRWNGLVTGRLVNWKIRRLLSIWSNFDRIYCVYNHTYTHMYI